MNAESFLFSPELLKYFIQHVIKNSISLLEEHLNSMEGFFNTELKILESSLMQKGEYVAWKEIMIKLWEDESFIDDNTFEVTRQE